MIRKMDGASGSRGESGTTWTHDSGSSQQQREARAPVPPAAAAAAAPAPDSDSASFECNICLDTAKDAVVSLCGHLFWYVTSSPTHTHTPAACLTDCLVRCVSFACWLLFSFSPCLR